MKLFAMSYGKVLWVAIDRRYLPMTGNIYGSFYCWLTAPKSQRR